MTEHNRPADPTSDALRAWADGLAASVPPVDAAMARRVAARHRRARLVTWSAAATLMIVVAGVVWVAAGRGSDGGTMPAASDDDAPVATMPAVDPTPVTATATGVGAAAGIEVAVEIPGQVLAGNPLPIDVTITNRGDADVYWQAGGCAIPTEVTVGPVGSTEVPRQLHPDTGGWDGDPGTLAGYLEGVAGDAGRIPAQPASMAGRRMIACTSDSRMEALEPGDDLTYAAIAELRVPAGALPADGAFDVEVAFTGYATADGYPAAPLDAIVARAALTVVDHPARAGGSARAVADAVVADGRLGAWVPTTHIPGRADLVQDFGVELTWWRDAWEMWAAPRWGGAGMIRLRIEPGTSAVTDARIVADGVPDDEPGASTVPGDRPDETIPPLTDTPAGTPGQ